MGNPSLGQILLLVHARKELEGRRVVEWAWAALCAFEIEPPLPALLPIQVVFACSCLLKLRACTVLDTSSPLIVLLNTSLVLHVRNLNEKSMHTLLSWRSS